MRSASTSSLFLAVLALTAFAIYAIWPDEPERYLPGDFWPSGNGVHIGSVDREAMRLGLDLRGGVRLVMEADPPAGYEGNIDDAVEGARDVIERRVNALGTSEAEISKASGSRIQVSIPGTTLARAQELVGRTAQLEFQVYDDANQLVPATGVVDGQTVVMTGQHLKNNTFPSRVGTQFVVNFETTLTGAKLLDQITGRALSFPPTDARNLLVVVLDGEIISQANVNGRISDQGIITGQRSFEEARDFADLLNSGSLPIPLRVIQADEVSASLGEDSVVDSVKAGEIGLIAVALFMILYYRLPGLLAAAALVVYTSLTLLIFKLGLPLGEPITLTLSGLAAFVLSVGMAVDANILIFERTKEELRRGRTLNAAIDIGFRRAWTSIRDSNVSTFITCLILYWFGDQFGAALVKGFALTLAIGVAVSMFSAITITRTFLKTIVGTPMARNHWLWNAEEQRRQPTRRAAPEPETAAGGK